MNQEDLTPYLKESFFFDLHTEEIEELVSEFQTQEILKKETAIQLYSKVRDGWRYHPYNISFEPDHLKSSYLYHQKEGHCIDKSILLIAGLRKLGIPSRLHLAKVKNHIAVESLMEKFGTNELTPHGMVDIYLDGRWLKASPAFNKELCKKCNVDILDFDGENDSLFQQYDQGNQLFMEYIEDYGAFEDVPIEFIVNNMKQHYPKLFKNNLEN